ncbi:retrovirus-related pol polyprotein from transposon TNT 1-94 [Tanacetum coccineum]
MFLKQVQLRLNASVRIVKTDNGTEFTKQWLKDHFEDIGITHQMWQAYTPQQNEVVKRRNHTLVKVARTTLIFSKAHLFLWADVVATTSFTHNRSILHTRYNKTPYELINDRKPNISFLYVFGALCYLYNDREDRGKLKAKEDLGSIIDSGLSEVVLGQPFAHTSKLTYDESLGLIRFAQRDDEVVFRMPQRTKELDLVSSLEKDKFEAFFVGNLKVRKKGFKHVFEKRKGYYKACMNLGLSFITEKVLKFNSFFESLGLVPPSSNTELVCTKEEDDDVMFIEIVPKDENFCNEEPEVGKHKVEHFDMFPTRSELAYHKTDEVAYKMPHKIEQYNSLSDLEKEHAKLVYLRNEEDKRRGVEYVMSKILGFYKGCLEFGPEYVTRMEDE